LPLLQQSTRPYMWRQWFESLGLSVAHDMSGSRMELFSMLSEAAADGLGVALVPPFLVEHDLAQGRLARLVDHEFRSDRSYYLIYPERKSENPGLATFRDWLDGEARRYRTAEGLG
jgi:LysR family glycine cleavage system transcriptional activator